MMILTLLMKQCQKGSMYLVYIYNSFVFNLILTFPDEVYIILIGLKFRVVETPTYRRSFL